MSTDLESLEVTTTAAEPLKATDDFKMQAGLDQDDKTPLLIYRSRKEVGAYLDRLRALQTTLKREEPLPTQMLFPNQSEEALQLAGRYIGTIRKLTDLLVKHGSTKEFESYSFRVAHFQNLNEWINIVVRLQFATALKSVLNTLNESLDPDAKYKWGVLEVDDAGIFSIDGKEITFGEKVDVFTTAETQHSGLIFDSHEALNCKAFDTETLPIVHYELDELKNLDSESMQKRYDAGISEKEHLLGVDAWSFFNVLFYKKHEPEVEPIQIFSRMLSMQDRDPALNSIQYDKDIETVSETELPFGLNLIAVPAIQSYFCKYLSRHQDYLKTIQMVKDNEKEFKKKVKAGVKDSILLGFLDLLQYLAGERSKLVKVQLILGTGEIVNAVTRDRQFSMEKLHIFNRFNIGTVYFNEIKSVTKKKTKFKDDAFELTDRLIKDTDVVAIVKSETKFYYFDDTATEESDPYFAMYMKIRRDFKQLDKTEKEA